MISDERAAELEKAAVERGDLPGPEPVRWSGYSTQSDAWRHGYERAYERGPYAKLACSQAIRKSGSCENDEDFMRGANFAVAERMGQ